MDSQEIDTRPTPGSGRTHTATAFTGAHRRWWMLAALPCLLVAVFSMRYLVAMGPFPPNIVANAFASPWLPIHVAGAASALLVGPFQFLPGLRQRRQQVHRWLGRTYVVGCTVGGIAGIPLALGATAGMVSTAGFGLLAIAWLAATSLGWMAAVRRQLDSHRAWMTRSFALTLAAVTLRLYLPMLELLPVDELHGYRAISFLCWVPNLVLAEVYLRWRRQDPSKEVPHPGAATPSTGEPARAPVCAPMK
jgi:uncharacterized membrane protein